MANHSGSASSAPCKTKPKATPSPLPTTPHHRMGHWLRHSKVDCLTELVNVLIGQMSLVGPRPDVPGYADQLQGDDRRILQLRPGITGPASIKYRNEEELLAQQADPKAYNDTVIWPDKVKINLDYLDNWSFFGDIKLIFNTLF